MNPDDAKQRYCDSEPALQARILASFAHLITIEARESYEVGGDGVVDPPRLRRSNEVIHRVVSQIRALLDEDPQRFPDDVLLRIVDEAAEGRGESILTKVVERASSE